MTRAGFVYILVNAGLPGHVKIGRTYRGADQRAREVGRQYGTLYGFEVHSKQMVSDCIAVESMTHRLLDWARVPRSELFHCDAATAQRAVRQAVILTLERGSLTRLWHRVILPRPKRATNAGGGRGSRRKQKPWPLVLVTTAILLIWGLHRYQPDLPGWLPEPFRHLALAIESASR